MKESEKLRVLLPHWMEHNDGHEAECVQWAEKARSEGLGSVADHIDAAVRAMREVNGHLARALDEAGGPASAEHHHHHHHHG